MNEQVIKNMNPVDIGEQLSALVDGELSQDQVRFLLRSIEAESRFAQDAARRWSSYHVISATLRREFVALPLREDFSVSVLNKLDATAPTPRTYAALRWLGGGAIAASVAVVALVVSRPADHAQGGAVVPNTVLAQQVTPAAVQPALQPNRAYLPLVPANPSPFAVVNPNNVMQASLESVLPNLYAPNGQLLSRSYLGDGAAPYVLSVQPVSYPATPSFGPMRMRPQTAQPNTVSTQP